ncbi:DUF4920 domain-containing protein [Mucilaginibacter myungsuensis]|uniref:DUF4920 domain-containing protein n=1 Tax=Mucilaginibacter myungsuensis TaxID=649104 RepID=A0A929L7M4_9SPHI|nr:DUF4920 domain-containing protein [Mucilaginibacter myungsuensis]MBE9664666.1 DUF4920 domain-containing protein [Mucilaginibacter myungsuensis]MDN3601129.1 DUF4920 domain-containing protein [Mucilaginibacter myungsuensis]
MKAILMFAFASLLTVGAKAQQSAITPAAPGVTYGKGAVAANAIAVQELPKAFKGDSVYKGQITGKVVQVCTKKGCFMKLEQANNETVMVRFTDYAFFMPQNIVGKTVVLDGTAKVTTTSVEDLQHYAKDLGKSKEEIAAIKEPKKGSEIMADGVLVVK